MPSVSLHLFQNWLLFAIIVFVAGMKRRSIQVLNYISPLMNLIENIFVFLLDIFISYFGNFLLISVFTDWDIEVFQQEVYLSLKIYVFMCVCAHVLSCVYVHMLHRCSHRDATKGCQLSSFFYFLMISWRIFFPLNQSLTFSQLSENSVSPMNFMSSLSELDLQVYVNHLQFCFSAGCEFWSL